eukprot:6194552-Pleurochrysis_carterae.AAC.2
MESGSLAETRRLRSADGVAPTSTGRVWPERGNAHVMLFIHDLVREAVTSYLANTNTNYLRRGSATLVHR